MVSSIYNNLNSLYAASFSEIGKTPAINAKTTPVDAARTPAQVLRDSLTSVGDDSQNKGRKGQPQFNLPDERQPTLASFTRPQVVLNPTDETQLFSVEDVQPPPKESQAEPQPSFTLEGAEPAQTQLVTNQLSRRQQSYVAQLYAQTNDITFNSDRVINQAA